MQRIGDAGDALHARKRVFLDRCGSMSAMSTQLNRTAGLRGQAFGETALVGFKRAAPVQKRKQLQVGAYSQRLCQTRL